jgi:glucose dehydrogenase
MFHFNKPIRLVRHSALALTLAVLAGCGTSENNVASETVATASTNAASGINAASITQGDANNWLSNGRTYDEQRHSPLDQINLDTVNDLGLAWYWNTGTKRGLEATPIVVDGVMFTSGAWSMVWAHDARTGELLWEFDPQVDRAWARYACCDVVNRGVAAWKGKIYVGTIDGRLIALDASTGKPAWDINTLLP